MANYVNDPDNNEQKIIDVFKLFNAQWKAQADSKTQAGRYTLEEAAKLIADNGNEDTGAVTARLMEAVKSGALTVYMPGATIPYTPATVRGFYEEAYWDDLNVWLTTNAPRLTFRFSDPSNAEPIGAGVETIGADTTLSDETGIMMKAALITHLDSLGFKDSCKAFRHSGDNGLSKMAKNSKHGYWSVGKAIEWFTMNKRCTPTKRSTLDGFGAKIQNIMGG